jgi:uncharacterized protein
MSNQNTHPEANAGLIPDTYPVFPLMKTVFFPNTLLPLHIFEERYRAMIHDTLEGDGYLAIGLCNHDEELTEVVGLGRIIQHEELADGRFHILVQGFHRIRIVEELPMEQYLYRRVKGELIEYRSEEQSQIDEQLRAFYLCLDRVLQSIPDSAEALSSLTERIQDPSVLADVVCAAVVDTHTERQSVLEEPLVSRRLQSATDALADLLLNHFPKKGQLLH